MSEDSEVFNMGTELPLQAFPIMEDIRRQGKMCDVTLKISLYKLFSSWKIYADRGKCVMLHSRLFVRQSNMQPFVKLNQLKPNQLVGDRKFRAHRIILAASIPYFHAMFTHDMVESKQDEIAMQACIDADALEALVNFAYNGRVEIDQHNVQSLMMAANFLQLQSVKDACCSFLIRRLHPQNCLGLRAFGDQYMCPSLVEAANKYLQKHFKDIVTTEEFLNMSKTDVTEILGRDELNVNTEEQVFEAALSWVKKDETSRKEILPDLMVKVRLPLLTPHFLSDRVASEELVKSSHKCRDLLDVARDYHLMPERRPLLQTFKVRPRCCTDIPGLIYAVGGLTSSGDSLSTVECFDPLLNRWSVAEAMSTMRSRVGVAVLNGKLYAIGGYDGTDRLNTVEVFEQEKKTWRKVAAMNCKRSALGAAALNRKLYVLGGYDGVTSLRSVEVYDQDNDMWTMLSNMLKHRSAAGVTVLDGEIYACGGHDGLSIFDSVECYNESTKIWRHVTPMTSKRCRLGVASLNGKLYAAGGYDGSVFLRTVECYDPSVNKWTAVKCMNVKRSRVALVSTYGKLYAIGGYDGQTNLNSVEVYDPDADTWTFVKPMCAHEGGVGVGVVPVEPEH